MSSAAASSSIVCTGGGRRRLRSRKTCSTRAVRWSCEGRGSHPLSWSRVSSPGSSNSASGLPRVSATIRSSDLGRRSRRPDAPRAGRGTRPGRDPSATSSGRPCGSKLAPGAVPGGEDHRHPVRPEPAGAEEQGARPSRGPASARRRRRTAPGSPPRRWSAATASPPPPGTARPTAPSSSPNATRSARAWGSGSPSRSLVSGRSSRCSAANASGASTSRPWVRSTVASPAPATSSSSSADLPTPGSPRTTSVPAEPVPRPLDKRSQELPLRLATDQHATNVHRAAAPQCAVEPGRLTGATRAA